MQGGAIYAPQKDGQPQRDASAMDGFLMMVRTDLDLRGFHYQANFALGECLVLARALGVPKGERRNPAILRFIRPQPIEKATPNTLSSRYGMGAFPFHTDAAYWRRPPRFVLFRCVNPGAADRPTLLINPRDSAFTEHDRRALCNEVWRMQTKTPFLCTAGFWSHNALALRFDEACMTPITRGAVRLRDMMREVMQQSPVTIVRWRAGDLLVVDNFRLLHARGEAKVPDDDRMLARVLIDG